MICQTLISRTVNMNDQLCKYNYSSIILQPILRMFQRSQDSRTDGSELKS
jgi:hypothetical protein